MMLYGHAFLMQKENDLGRAPKIIAQMEAGFVYVKCDRLVPWFRDYDAWNAYILAQMELPSFIQMNEEEDIPIEEI